MQRTFLTSTHCGRPGGAVDASHPTYQKRLARAKSINSGSGAVSGPGGSERAGSEFSLDLSGLRVSGADLPAEGDHKLGAGQEGILTTPRAEQDVAISVRGAPKSARPFRRGQLVVESLGSGASEPVLSRGRGAAVGPRLSAAALHAFARASTSGTSIASSSSSDQTRWAQARSSLRGGPAAPAGCRLFQQRSVTALRERAWRLQGLGLPLRIPEYSPIGLGACRGLRSSRLRPRRG